ncbi:MAG: PIG-L family deacetylase [Planctomycetota bacterium]
MKMRSLSLSSALLVLAVPVAAQGRLPDAGLVGLYQAYRDHLSHTVVLNVAAHPDDEASRTNTILRRKYGARVVTVYATYGDGGQNAIGREIGPELAHIRVRETLAAAAKSGAEVRWLGFPDFGFSKSLDETLDVWGRDKVCDAMRAVLVDVKPTLIVTNHGVDRGHGHHRACAWALFEVLQGMAAKGGTVPPTFSRSGPEEAWVEADPAEVDVATGETYARLAYEAWVSHESQGPWGPFDPMRVTKEWWQLVLPKGVAPPRAGEPRDWSRWVAVDAPPEAGTSLAIALGLLPAAGPNAAGGEFAERLRLMQAGVSVETWLERDVVALDGKGIVNVVVHAPEHAGEIAVACNGVAASPVASPTRVRLFELPDRPVDPATTPKFQAGRFTVPFTPAHGADGGVPPGPEPSFVTVDIALGAVHEQRRLPYTVVAPVEVQPDREVLLVPKGKTVERAFSVSVTTHRDSEPDTPLRLGVGPGVQATTSPGRLQLTKDHAEARVLVRATIAADELTPDAGITVGFGDAAARVRIVVADVKVPDGLRIALVRGPEDTTERALVDLGVDVMPLDRDQLMTVPLAQFSTLLLDIRANYHRPELAEMRDRILQFCRAGGRVVAMYHKAGEWNVADGQLSLAPFQLVVGNDRVSDERAAVTFLAPDDPLLQRPNAITPADFDGWVQERGLNFPSRWDSAWTPLLRMQDPGADEKPLDGALLHTRYGKGDYVYCSLALYRQLRAGNVGAARLLVNLLDGR